MPAIAQGMPEIKWRMASSFPKSLPTLYGGAEYLCSRIAAATDNRFQIRPFAAGEIVPALQVLDAVQNGTVECGQTAPLLLRRQGPDLRLRLHHALRPERAPAAGMDAARRRAAS